METHHFAKNAIKKTSVQFVQVADNKSKENMQNSMENVTTTTVSNAINAGKLLLEHMCILYVALFIVTNAVISKKNKQVRLMHT